MCDDFSADWDGPARCKLFVQNGARAQHGIANSNLSLLAWRSATILNAILGRPVFDCSPVSGALTWQESEADTPLFVAQA